LVYALYLFYSEILHIWYGWKFRRKGRSFGLRSVRLSPELAAQIRQLPLAQSLLPDPVQLSSRCLQGQIQDHEVTVLVLSFTVVFYPYTERGIAYSAAQTVALLPGLAQSARFHLGPPNKFREEMFENWAGRQGMPIRTVVSGGELSASLDARLAGLTPELVERLASFEGWTIEGAAGLVMVYRLAVWAAPNDLGQFLEAVRRIASVLQDVRTADGATNPPRLVPTESTALTHPPEKIELRSNEGKPNP